MRSRTVIALAVAMAAVAAISVLALVYQHASDGPQASALPAGAPPAGASAAAQLLVSTRGRTALTPELRAALPAGRLFPAGTTFVPKPGTWHQAGAFANLTGILRERGHLARIAEVGLVDRHGHWLVTFEASP